MDAATIRNVELPADPHDRKALVHQKAIAVPPGAATVESQGGLVPPVRNIDQRHTVPALRIGRRQDHQIGGRFHHSLTVPRRAIQVRDDLVHWIVRVDRERDPTDDLLIGTDVAKASPVFEGTTLDDVDRRNIGGDRGRKQGRDEQSGGERSELGSHGR